MQAVLELAERIALRLGQIDGVVAVVLGGSWARGSARPDSDIDLGVYYHPGRQPSLAALRQLAREVDDRHPVDAATEFGAWGPWINGGAWLEIEGRHVDWLYRDLEQVRQAVKECRAGITACHYQPGHPHGFHTHFYMGEVHLCRVLHDPQGEVAALKALTTPYPPLLKRALVGKYGWEAEFMLGFVDKLAEQRDVAYVAGCLYRSVACLVQALFALNERYVINEKGSVRAIETFPLRPPGFATTVEAVLGQPGTTPQQLRESAARLRELTRAVQRLGVEAGI